MKKTNSNQFQIIKSNFFYPHGGLIIWIFVILELLAFGIAFGAYFYTRSHQFDLFSKAQLGLNQRLATLNTLILISSGYLLALANRNYQKISIKKTGFLILSAILLGVFFIFIKFTEYKEKLQIGLGTGVNDFYDFYWILTAFHALHVILGIFILSYFSYIFLCQKTKPQKNESFEASVIYWHMCDLIWILLFPIIYLL